MVTRKDDEFEEDEEDGGDKPVKPKFSIGATTIVLGVIFLILVESFLYLLSAKTPAEFGVKEIVFGVIISAVITLFFAWVNFIMRSNKYMGSIIGIIGTGAMMYALTRKYKGTYTTTFMIITAVIVIIYLAMHFLKSHNK